MRFQKNAVLAAIMVALTLTTSQTTFAEPKDEELRLATMPNLAVEVSNHGSDQTLVVRNTGSVASAACQMRETFSTGEVYILPVMELAPGAVQYLYPPQTRDGKPFSIQIELDCHEEVLEAIEEDNAVTVRFIG